MRITRTGDRANKESDFYAPSHSNRQIHIEIERDMCCSPECAQVANTLGCVNELRRTDLLSVVFNSGMCVRAFVCV